MTSTDQQAWGPEVAARGRRRRLLRLLPLALLMLLLAMLLVLLASWLRLERTPVAGLASGGQPLHVLVVGSDSREGLSREEQLELSTGVGDFGDERTDSIFVLTVQGGRAAMLAFPRDLWVTRCDGSVGRINVASAIDGPGCLVDTIRELSGIHVHHHLRVTFGGFRDVVDAVGGVELCLPEPINDRDAGIDLPAGCQELDGADALGFVRVRKIDDDLQRIRRQQEFVQALAREISQPSVLLNPVTLWRLSGEVGDAVEVDRRFGPVSAVRLGWAAPGIARGQVATHTVPTAPRITSGGAYVLDPVQPDAEALFARFRDGSVLDELPEPDPEAAPLPAPAEVTVTVANGAGIGGLAGRIAGDLEALGYQVAGVTNAPTTDRTVVRHPPGQEPAARRVLADVPGSGTLEETTDVAHVTVILGPEADS